MGGKSVNFNDQNNKVSADILFEFIFVSLLYGIKIAPLDLFHLIINSL